MRTFAPVAMSNIFDHIFALSQAQLKSAGDEKNAQMEAENDRLKEEITRLEKHLEKERQVALDESDSMQGMSSQLAAENKALEDALKKMETALKQKDADLTHKTVEFSAKFAEAHDLHGQTNGMKEKSLANQTLQNENRCHPKPCLSAPMSPDRTHLVHHAPSCCAPIFDM